jgi:AraC-like DNA-binding protein
MLEECYNIISIYIGGSIFFAFGICLLFLSVAECPQLRNYLKARRIMASAYLFLALCNVAEHFSRSSHDNIQLTQIITLLIGCSQSFLFTYVFITLINPQFLSGKKITRIVSLFLLFVAVLFAIYVLCPPEWFNGLLGAYIIIYLYLIVRISLMFMAHYRRYMLSMDNFYSGDEALHLNWVRVSFFAALAIGVTALLNALFMSEWGALLFSVIVIVFYIIFAIRFLNYQFVFRYLEPAITPAPATVVETLLATSIPENANEIPGKMHSDTFVMLEKRIERWLADKGFTEAGITIDTLAALLYTNQKYLSSYINTRKKQTFRKWINELRIEEAKILLLQEPKTTLTEIFFRAGFSEKSHFLRQFKEQTGVSPTEWKNSVRTQNFHVSTPK